MRGVEPLSENIAIQLSPSADDIFYFASQMPIDGRPSCYPKVFPKKLQGEGFKVSCLLTVLPHRQEKLREQLAVRLLKRILVQRLYLNGPPIIVQMEPRLAYHTAPTPVETSTSPVRRSRYATTSCSTFIAEALLNIPHILDYAKDISLLFYYYSTV